MVSRTLRLCSSMGFHVRAAGVFAREMVKFPCEVWVSRNEVRANGKSMMELVAASFRCGDEVVVRCHGPEEQSALKKAVELIENGLGETR